ncbi:MAG: ABC-2 family transporter protein [Verrucomicrobiota bacterium]
MKHHFRVFRLMFRNSLIREMNFAANFWLWLVTELLWFMAQVGMIEVIFSHVNSIGDWNKWHVILLMGTHQITAQLFQAFFYMNLANLPELVRTGKLDFLLLQPVNAQFVASSKQFGFDNLVNTLIGIGFVFYASHQLHLHPSFTQITLYLLCILCGIGIHYSLLFFLVTLSFWIVKAQGMIYGYYNLMNLARYPESVFLNAPKVWRILFSVGIPIMVVANVPTRILAHITSGTPMIWLGSSLVVGTFLTLWGSSVFWRYALRSYTSASS